MGNIILNDRSFSFDQIKSGDFETDDSYFHAALIFCSAWLNGQEAFILKTSGSTGTPKSITLQRNQMETSARATGAFFDVKQNVKLLCCLNTEMIAGKMMLVRALEWDSQLYLIHPRQNPLSEVSIHFDFAAMVPLQVSACLNELQSTERLKKIKTLIIGGAPSDPSLLKKINSFSLNAYQTYGMTETVSHIALAKITGHELIYTCLPTVRIGTDPENRLWVEGPMVHEPRLQTNDLVALVSENQFQWLGRADFTINSGGIKIQPEVLEPLLEPYIHKFYPKAAFFVFGKEDERLGQKTVLLIETREPGKQNAAALLNMLKSLFPKYQVPKEVVLVPEFIKTASGKVNRLSTINSLL